MQDEINVDLEVTVDEDEESAVKVAVDVESETPNKTKDASSSQRPRLVRLPLARIKQMMKKDPDCELISQDSVFLITKATEMFIELLSKEACKQIATCKRKTVMKRDVECAIDTIPHLCFLDGALE